MPRVWQMLARLDHCSTAELVGIQLATKISTGEDLTKIISWFLSIPNNLGNEDTNQAAKDFNRHVTHKYSVHDITKQL